MWHWDYVALIDRRRLDHYRQLEREHIHLAFLEKASRDLNDVASLGGETEFALQDVSVRPAEGKLVLFPPLDAHPPRRDRRAGRQVHRHNVGVFCVRTKLL
jgi:hypothetical protein